MLPALRATLRQSRCVGQDVARQDGEPARAQGARGGHEVLVLDAHHRPPGDAGDLGPPEDRQNEDDGEDRGAPLEHLHNDDHRQDEKHLASSASAATPR